MGMFSRYEKVGPGVSKNPDDKLPLFKFFDVYFSHLSKLICLNFLYIIALLPFCLLMIVEYFFKYDTSIYYVAFYIAFICMGVIFGPATCGFTKIVRNISTYRPVFLWHDFWAAFKSNFKQGAVMGLIDMIFIVAMSFAFPMYYDMSQKNSMFFIPFAICVVCSVLFVMLHFYIYLLIISTNLGLWKILKNSFLLTAIAIKASIINLIVTAASAMLILVLFPYSAFMVVIIPSFLGTVYAFNCFPVIRKYVIQPWYDQRGEVNPEFSQNSSDEAIFVDVPDEEASINEKRGSRVRSKGKRIR